MSNWGIPAPGLFRGLVMSVTPAHFGGRYCFAWLGRPRIKSGSRSAECRRRASIQQVLKPQRGGGSAGRTPGRAFPIPGVIGLAVQIVKGLCVRAKSGHVGLAKDDGARVHQCLSNISVVGGPIFPVAFYTKGGWKEWEKSRQE